VSRKINDGLTNDQRYWRKHPEKQREKGRRQYKAHAEARRESARKRYWIRKGGWTEEDRARMRVNSLRYFHRHREEIKELNRRKQAERLSLINACKEVPCVDCGQQYAHYVMEFDHRTPRKGTAVKPISSYVGKSWERIMTEIDKCDIVCANCHRARTWKRRQKSSS
jgi:hypothetical protein